MFLDGFVRRDEPGGVVGAEEVPGVEAGEVLKGAKELIATDCCRNEAQVVSYRGVVYDRVCYHLQGHTGDSVGWGGGDCCEVSSSLVGNGDGLAPERWRQSDVGPRSKIWSRAASGLHSFCKHEVSPAHMQRLQRLQTLITVTNAH